MPLPWEYFVFLLAWWCIGRIINTFDHTMTDDSPKPDDDDQDDGLDDVLEDAPTTPPNMYGEE